MCSLHLHNAGKAGSWGSVVCSYSLHARVKRMGFSICSMVVDDVHFLCFFSHPGLLLLLNLNLPYLKILNE